MLISPASRHRLQDLDPRWSAELIVRLVTSHFSLIALSLFAAVIEPWKRNFVHMNTPTPAPGAWQDGLPIAPLLLSVFFNTISSIYTLTRGKLAHPTFKLTADFLVCAFLIPAMALVISGGAFRLWRPTVKSAGNSITCTEENVFARECFPELYRVGSMELAGLGFAGATWLLHLSLFVYTCRATFTIRLRKSTMKGKHSPNASKSKSSSDSESGNESDNEERNSSENGSAIAQKRKREAKGHRGKSRTGHTSRNNSRSRSRSRNGAKRGMDAEKNLKIEGSNTSVNKVRFLSPDLSSTYSDSDIQNEMRRDKERARERETRRQRMREIEKERARETEKRRQRARELERDIERQRRRRREMERGREIVGGYGFDGDSRSRSRSGASGKTDKSVDYKSDYGEDIRDYRSRRSTRAVADPKIKRKAINTTNGILKNKNSNTTLRENRANDATANANTTARRDAGFKKIATFDGRQGVGTGGSISSIRSNPWTDGEARKFEPPTVTTTITTETSRRNGKNSILKNRSSSGIVYTDDVNYNNSTKINTSNGDNTTARGNDEDGPKGIIDNDTTHLKNSLRRKPSSVSNYSARSIHSTINTNGGVVRSTSKSTTTNIRNSEAITTTTTTTNNSQEHDIGNNNNDNDRRPSLPNSNSNPHPRQNGHLLRRDVVVELDTGSPRKELSVPYDMTVNRITIPARAASRRGKEVK
ncbi:hypothetical protein FQN50_005491 [Emmonsiellopsis sp. PD_5]|nr:hypothetical protein FQN50_005491 [Emmonsiellopsis sp. PD_5]